MEEKKKRDLSEEIKLIQARASLQGRYEYWIQLNEIEKVLIQIITDTGDIKLPYFIGNQELLRYIPIATVACIQSFFRSAIKELIDTGEPFNKNVAKYKGLVRPPDYDILAEIQSNEFTIGEFVAHSLSYSNYEIIDSNIRILLDESLTQKLLNQSEKSIHKGINKEINNFKKQFPSIKKSIDIIFKMRHAFCHESASNVKLDKEKVKKHFLNCKLFLEHSSWVISNAINPNSPRTQLEMNQEARESYVKKDKELNDLIEKIKLIKYESIFPWDEADNKLFDEVQEKWKEYRELYALNSSFKSKGGSIHSLMYGSALGAITDERLQGLKKQYGDLLECKEEYSFES